MMEWLTDISSRHVPLNAFHDPLITLSLPQ